MRWKAWYGRENDQNIEEHHEKRTFSYFSKMFNPPPLKKTNKQTNKQKNTFRGQLGNIPSHTHKKRL